jgi:hypothetical protein
MNAPPSPLIDFLLRFRERERENAAQSVPTPDPRVEITRTVSDLTRLGARHPK